MPKTKLQVPFPEPKNLVEYGTIEGTTEERCQLASDHLILILNCVAVGKRQSLRLQAIGVTGRVILQCV